MNSATSNQVLLNGIFITSIEKDGIPTGYKLTQQLTGLRIATFASAKFALECAKALTQIANFYLEPAQMVRFKDAIQATIKAFNDAEDIELGHVDDDLDLVC